MASLRIGLTGGLAAGKSTVAEWMRQAGLNVIDADQVVARLYRAGGEGTAAVVRLFGESALDDEGGVDHARLAALVFSDPQARERLEAAIHPLVRREFTAAAQAGQTVVLEAPLLVEAGFDQELDLVITVEADPELRLQRAVARGLDAAEARRRLAAQVDETVRTAAADRILRNDGDLEDLRQQVTALIGEIFSMADDAE